MHHLESEIDRNQLSMIALEQMVDQNSFARLVDIFVDALPLKELGFVNTVHEQSGRPPYHPSVLLKLYMYGYRHGLRSSNKLHQACLVNVEVWWLIKGLKPSPRTICYFRKNNALAFKKAFQHFVLLLKEWKLIDGETIAIDSFKIRAQNSLKNNFNQAKIDRHVDYIDNKIADYQSQLDEADNVDTRSELASKIDYQKKKKDAYKAIEKELIDSGQRQISKTDKDAKAVVLHRNIVNVGYNIQAGSDAKHKLFVNAQTGKVNDTHALADMAIEAKELLGVKKMKTLTDKGYTTGLEMAKCQENNITPYSSPKAHSSQKNGLYDMQIFKYNKRKDTYTCPAGATMQTNGTIYNKSNHKVRHYKTKACKRCAIRDQCTKNKNGRFIERGMYQEVLEQNEKRVNNNPQYYRLRQQITEHQFGTIKRQWGFTFTLMKGKENVLSEVYLNFSVYNLLRCIKILGYDKMVKRLQKLLLFINLFFGTDICKMSNLKKERIIKQTLMHFEKIRSVNNYILPKSYF
jgi:transposase